jgi:hypothetical protein
MSRVRNIIVKSCHSDLGTVDFVTAAAEKNNGLNFAGERREKDR